MHDPSTLAFTIKLPAPWRKKSQWEPKPSITIAYIWHEDPETDGTDDSCGWFCRARHGDKAKLKVMENELDFECYAEHGGMFDADGKPRYSTYAIVLNMFRRVAYIYFNNSWSKTNAFMKRNLYEILSLAENPVDSLHTGITNKYGVTSREDRVSDLAHCIYGWILRAERPWYRHPKWHIHHWSIQVPVLKQLKRSIFERCSTCGGRFRWGHMVCSDWSGRNIRHMDCDRPATDGSVKADC